ncbi:hypothetical protein E3U43_004948 [Larimichthys crocea]|uniref:Uncharacterized protein n=1 Tax=Larimichthys crocea TaxID=215358 RepID=A0ACD3QF22_LARCR|nr:hypothetical protein E3U43_004948 [Larimichthys crocea]
MHWLSIILPLWGKNQRIIGYIDPHPASLGPAWPMHDWPRHVRRGGRSLSALGSVQADAQPSTVEEGESSECGGTWDESTVQTEVPASDREPKDGQAVAAEDGEQDEHDERRARSRGRLGRRVHLHLRQLSTGLRLSG